MSAPLSGFGVDTLRLTGETTDGWFEALQDKRVSQFLDDDTGELIDELRGGSAVVKVEETFARVTANHRPGFPSVSIEVSAPSVLHGHNIRPLAVEHLDDVARLVVDAVRVDFPEVPAFKDLQLTRLDLDRDFVDIDDVGSVLRSVHGRTATRTPYDSLARGSSGRHTSLTRGAMSSWLVVGYDKGEQMRDRAHRRRDHRTALAVATLTGQLRFEVQMRTPTLRRSNIKVVDDVSEVSARDLTKTFFTRTRYDGPLTGTLDHVRAALDSLTPAEHRAVTSVLTCDLLSLEPRMGHNLLSSTRAIIRRLDLSPQDLLGTTATGSRLDFDSGRIVED